MNQQTEQVLKNRFGYSEFRGHQRQVIDTVIAGNNALVLMPTGGGKSLCYQIPALILPGTAIVVSPLIALMQDQVASLQQQGVAAAFLNSTLTTDQQVEVINQIKSDNLDLLYIAPERLLQQDTLDLLAQCTISLIAIDEAHCVSQWGHDFREDYLGLSVLAEQFVNVPRIALTATADQRTRKEIVNRLALDSAKIFISSFDRPNIRYIVHSKTNVKRQLLEFLQNHQQQSGIVYCMTRKRVDSFAAWLQSKGINALPYHAGMTNEERAENQQQFLQEEGIVIVATIAFGMGIDKPDVRFVAHLDLPKSMESYYQETGRAGRDGRPSTAWMTYGLEDVVRIKKMLDMSMAGEEIKQIERKKVDSLLAWCEITQCRRQALLNYFSESSDGNCGNCDVCLNPPKTDDATEDAQKMLSNIYRTEQQFGAIHIIDVIVGKQSPKVTQFGHQNLSTFGIGADKSANYWRSVIRQLIIQNYLWVNEQQYGAIQLTKNARKILRGEDTFQLRVDAVKPKQSTRTQQRDIPDEIPTEKQQQWDQLKQLRKQLADKHGVPPYVIFHDSSLKDMLQQLPKNDFEFLQINGVGEAKLEKYGTEFLKLIAQFQ